MWILTPSVLSNAELCLAAARAYHCAPCPPPAAPWMLLLGCELPRQFLVLCSSWCPLYLINLVTTNQPVSLARMPYLSTQVPSEFFLWGCTRSNPNAEDYISVYRISFPVVGSIEQVGPGKEMLISHSFTIDIL